MTDADVVTLLARVEGAVAEARQAFRRAVQPGQPNVMSWRGIEYWVDQERWVTFPARLAEQEGLLGESTAATRSQLDLVEFAVGPYRTETSEDIVRFIARWVDGYRSGPQLPSAQDTFLNCVVVQPLVNPAFEPLFWLSLMQDMGRTPPCANLIDELGPMMFDMVTWPSSRASADGVRNGQAAFIERLEPGWAPGVATRYTAEEWLAACRSLRGKHARLIDVRVFADAIDWAG